MANRRFNTTALTQELHRLTGLSFNARLCNALGSEGVSTVEEFLVLDPNTYHIPNIGMKSIQLIREAQKALIPPVKAPAGLSPLEWELWWIDQHVDRYTSPEHAEAVKRNIEKRYRIAELERTVAEQQSALDEAFKTVRDCIQTILNVFRRK